MQWCVRVCGGGEGRWVISRKFRGWCGQGAAASGVLLGVAGWQAPGAAQPRRPIPLLPLFLMPTLVVHPTSLLLPAPSLPSPQKLRREAERAKRALSSQHQVRVEIESLVEGVDLSEPLTRARFEELNNDLFKKTLTPVRKVRTEAERERGGEGASRARPAEPHCLRAGGRDQLPA